MLKSMTAFARVEAKDEFGSLVWEIRSVNHRYLDTSIRLPEDLRGLEQKIREAVAGYLKRGKVDCTLKYKAEASTVSTINVNLQYAQDVIGACEQINGLLNNASATRAVDILRWPGVVKEPERDQSPVEQLAMQQLTQAIQELIATREREGARILEMLQQRCGAISQLVQQVRERRPQVLQAIRTKLETKVADLQAKVDQDRLEQELVIIAQRMDVDEELDRLDTHITEVESVLGKKEPVGRRLDFLMQELNREANTLSSKSADSETTQVAVDLKVLIEQMREQIQNVE